MKRLLMVMLVMSWASPVWAAFNSGNQLIAFCQASEMDPGNAYCLGYMAGTFDALDGADRGAGGYTFCNPGVTLNQVRDVVVMWLSDHPQHRHHDAHTLVAAALNEVWPCP